MCVLYLDNYDTVDVPVDSNVGYKAYDIEINRNYKTAAVYTLFTIYKIFKLHLHCSNNNDFQGRAEPGRVLAVCRSRGWPHHEE